MEPLHENRWEQSLEQLARRMEYPPTPDIVADIRPRTTDRDARSSRRPSSVVGRQPRGRPSPVSRRLAWAWIIIALIAAAALAVPQTRAAVMSLFARIGAIDIQIDEAAPAPRPTLAVTAAPGPSGDTVRHSMALFEMGEAVTLDEARRSVDFLLALPPGLGQPDEVYAHPQVDVPAVTLVWRDDGGVALSLTEIGAAGFALKMVAEENVKWVHAGDRDAVWIEGPHTLHLFGHQEDGRLLIESNVLVWTDENVTYRLEGDRTEVEMIAIAESMAE